MGAGIPLNWTFGNRIALYFSIFDRGDLKFKGTLRYN